jgi:hypothetical protein
MIAAMNSTIQIQNRLRPLLRVVGAAVRSARSGSRRAGSFGNCRCGVAIDRYHPLPLDSTGAPHPGFAQKSSWYGNRKCEIYANKTAPSGRIQEPVPVKIDLPNQFCRISPV